jgi:aminopeptidase N
MRPVVIIAACTAALFCGIPSLGHAQDKKVFTRADTLRGTVTPERAWWDVTYYDLHVRIAPGDSSIRGYNGITYKVIAPAREMQIDLMTPLEVDSMIQDGRSLTFRRDGNVFYATTVAPQTVGNVKTVTVYYHGKPRVAKKAPWDGGFIWARDTAGRDWVSVACQGFGASVWWPNKDIQSEEPDSQRIAVTVPDPMVEVSNGRLRGTVKNNDGTTTYDWFVGNPINNYDVSVNAGSYTHYGDSYAGEQGTLTMDFWPLAQNLGKAKAQFTQATPMLKCFEHWFGPFPWYTDGYKLVETPFLGMEHQSAVAYGNHYANGYLGRDLSHTGHGMLWDFILIHESGHEWFGNNITTKDIADMWVHEGFTNYSEGLYTECQEGKAAGAAYMIGLRKNVQNDTPIIGSYGVNSEGSSDMYYKASNMLHTMRQIIDNDEQWRAILRGLGSTFRHQTVTGAQVQAYMNQQSGINFDKVFAQYLATTTIPVLEYKLSGPALSYRWADVVPGFDMPVKIAVSSSTSPSAYQLVHPTEQWQTMVAKLGSGDTLRVDENFYVNVRKVD